MVSSNQCGRSFDPLWSSCPAGYALNALLFKPCFAEDVLNKSLFKGSGLGSALSPGAVQANRCSCVAPMERQAQSHAVNMLLFNLAVSTAALNKPLFKDSGLGSDPSQGISQPMWSFIWPALEFQPCRLCLERVVVQALLCRRCLEQIFVQGQWFE